MRVFGRTHLSRGAAVPGLDSDRFFSIDSFCCRDFLDAESPRCSETYAPVCLGLLRKAGFSALYNGSPVGCYLLVVNQISFLSFHCMFGGDFESAGRQGRVFGYWILDFDPIECLFLLLGRSGEK